MPRITKDRPPTAEDFSSTIGFQAKLWLGEGSPLWPMRESLQ